jgi:hypothetical protein
MAERFDYICLSNQSKMPNRLLFLALVIFFSACDSSTTTPKPDPEPEVVPQATDHIAEINQGGFVLNISIPADYKDGNEVKVRFDDAFGHLEVLCGDVFAIHITEEESNVETFQQRLETDLLMKHEVLEKQGNSMLYKQFLPDNSKEFWHFYVGVQSNGTSYLIRDISMQPLNEFQARKIYESLLSTKSGV